jgi:pimeloyl-ACP methyl ester carboxylesterase
VPFITRSGVRIHYEVEGKGPPVVCLPGLGYGHERGYLAPWIESLPPHRWIGVSPRGSGPSDKPRDRHAHRIEEYRDDVLAVMDALEVPTAVCLGFAAGGQLGYALADAYPKRIVALIDYDGISGLTSEQAQRDAADFVRGVRDMGWDAWISEFARASGATDSSRQLQVLRQAETEMVALQIEGWSDRTYPFDLVPRLEVPTLILLNGARDRSEVARIEARAGSNCEVHVIPGTNHWKLCFEAAHSLEIVRRFLERIET